MKDCQPCRIPMIPNTHLVPSTPADISEFDATGKTHRHAVGLLNYLVLCTRPDLGLVASQQAQFLEHPGSEHWCAFKRVLWYLQHTSQVGLKLGALNMDLTINSDSDHAGCPYTRWSITGYCAIVAGGCLSWRARKQPTVATSSTKAKYRAACEFPWRNSSTQVSDTLNRR